MKVSDRHFTANLNNLQNQQQNLNQSNQNQAQRVACCGVSTSRMNT
ncbi:MAG: hypothetical protein IJR84_00505 [Bacteroidaceae bacterium]|nr:hypothetical protein [Bacteroidaceae bacterium]